MTNGDRTSYRVCPLCEATCGLEIKTRGRDVVGIRGDEADPFSRGFICPKGYALKGLDADPDRLRAVVADRSLWGRSGGVPILPCTLDHNSLVGAAELAWQPVLDDPLGALVR